MIYVEEGVKVYINANNEQEATKKADDLASYWGGTNYPREYEPSHKHRDWSVESVKPTKLRLEQNGIR